MALQQEKAARLDRLSKKRQLLAQLLTQQVSSMLMMSYIIFLHMFGSCQLPYQSFHHIYIPFSSDVIHHVAHLHVDIISSYRIHFSNISAITC